jgi:hypothetical protein
MASVHETNAIPSALSSSEFSRCFNERAKRSNFHTQTTSIFPFLQSWISWSSAGLLSLPPETPRSQLWPPGAIGAGHISWFEQSDLVFSAVDSFLTGSWPEGSSKSSWFH